MGPPSGPSLCVPGADVLRRTQPSCPPYGWVWCGHLGSASVLGALTLGPAGPQRRPSACPVSSFSLGSVARDPQELWRFLVQNLSLPNSTAQALLAAQVDLPEVSGTSVRSEHVSLLGVAPGPGLSSLPSPACRNGEQGGGMRGSEAALGPGSGTPWPEPRPLYTPGLSPAFWPFACPRRGVRTPQGSGPALEPPG